MGSFSIQAGVCESQRQLHGDGHTACDVAKEPQVMCH